MSDNSIREQIIEADKAIIESMSNIKTVIRRLPSYADLQQFALSQFPAVVVVGRMPEPENHISRRDGQVDQCLSELKVDLFIFIQENENADSQISSLLDDFWRVLYLNPTRNNLVLITELIAEENIEIWEPFVAFKITCKHKYKHTTGGI